MESLAARTSRALDAGSILPLAGIAVYVVSSILYVFPPGLPQPADCLLIATVVATFSLSWRYLPEDPFLYVTLALFLGWIILVNSIWFLLEHDYRFLQSTLFYLFNAVVFIFMVGVALRDFDRLCTVIYWSAVAAIVVEVAYIELIDAGVGRRTMGTFNNPNQLGYWMLLAFACIGVAKRHERVTLVDVAAFGLGLYAVALSLSRAAMVAAAVLVVAILAAKGIRPRAGVALAAVLMAGVVYEVASGDLVDRFTKSELVVAVDQRLGKIAEAGEDGDMARRGYKRLVDSPQYLALGAGEGAYARLTEERWNKEFHSTLGNIVMSYGVVGLTFFGLFLFNVFRRSHWSTWFYLFGLMLYGIAHMGLRDSLFWFFLALVFAQGRLATSERAGLRLGHGMAPASPVAAHVFPTRR